jgi:hypothetical protein
VIKQLLTSGLLTLALIGCSSGGQAPTVPGVPTQPPGGAPTAPPGGQPTPAGQPAGDLETRVRALIPPGSTEISEASAGGAYQLNLSNTGQTLEQLQAFWTQQVPAAGFTFTGAFIQGDALTVAFSNPSGGAVAVRNTGTGETIITLSAGT